MLDPLFIIACLFGALAIVMWLTGWPPGDGDYEDWDKHLDPEAPNRKRRGRP